MHLRFRTVVGVSGPSEDFFGNAIVPRSKQGLSFELTTSTARLLFARTPSVRCQNGKFIPAPSLACFQEKTSPCKTNIPLKFSQLHFVPVLPHDADQIRRAKPDRGGVVVGMNADQPVRQIAVDEKLYPASRIVQ